MTRVLAQYVSLETAALGLVELVLSFLIIETVLSLPGAILASPVQAADLTLLAALFAVITAGTATTIGLYRPEVCMEWRRLLVTATVAGVVAFPILLLVSGGFHIILTSGVAVSLALLLLAWQAGILVTHLAFQAVVRPGAMLRRVLIVGTDGHAARLKDILRSRRARFEPVPDSDAAQLSPDALRRQRIWAVVVADAPSGSDTLLDSKLRGTRVLSVAAFCEQYLGRIDLETADNNWLLCADGFAQSRIGNAVKRSVDIVASLVLLLLTLPVMLATAVLIKLDSPGPALYPQQRLGLHGRPFILFKFRSMRQDAEAGGNPRWAQQQDPRVTRVGRFIRPMRIDELPQLFNVLLGQMSLVGPRPERPHFVQQLGRVIPQYRHRAYVKPGITGWAQVNYPYGASVEDAREKLAYDLFYVKNRGVLFDLVVLLMTVRVILFREGGR